VSRIESPGQMEGIYSDPIIDYDDGHGEDDADSSASSSATAAETTVKPAAMSMEEIRQELERIQRDTRERRSKK
ncbi:MAG: hypothetical protein AAB967_00190, partial [Patescibacteria group bacterium]